MLFDIGFSPPPAIPTLIITGILVFLSWFFVSRRYHRPVDYQGKHCYITGGSQGLGKALARLLLSKGANVSIVARTESVLQQAILELKIHRENKEQKVCYVVADVSKIGEAYTAISKATQLQNDCPPDIVFCCAGVAMPGLFLEQDIEVFRQSMDINYFGALYTIKAALEKIIPRNKDRELAGNEQPKVVFISSMAGLVSFAGYSQYSPSKFALRGLAESLRNELKLYNVGVHIFFPGSIYSPGYVRENEIKPEITKKIEGMTKLLSADQCALKLLNGIDKGEIMITSNFDGNLLRCITKGMMPHNSFFFDPILAFVGSVLSKAYQIYWDYLVTREAKNQ